jgi:hypothetical protein
MHTSLSHPAVFVTSIGMAAFLGANPPNFALCGRELISGCHHECCGPD